MDPALIDGVLITPQKRILNPGGDILHALKRTGTGYVGFGEAYFSIINQDVVKAWKKHMKMNMNIVVPIGKIKFVFFDILNNTYREEVIGSENYNRLTIPSDVWFGFKGLDKQNLLLNISDILHDPYEVERKNILEIPFNWSKL